jgi:Secretion system C-terminal sorting domain
MKKNVQKLLALAFTLFTLNAISQNEVYWKEGFEPGATPACDLGTVAPTATGGNYFNGNAGSWYGFNVYRTTGTGCPAGNNHVRYKNISGVTDSGYLITPIVNFGINEFHIARARASRSYTLWITNDTSATTANWTMFKLMKSSASTTPCVDTMVSINSVTAKRLKIVGRPGTDTDIDSIWITSVNHILPVKFGGISASQASGLVKINWSIESEINTNNYTIERSVNGENYTAIGTLNATQSKAYNWVDKTPNTGVNYYRIKAIDNNGSFMYSNAIKINNGKTKTELSLYPNPVINGKINVEASGLTKGLYTINVYSITGAKVYTTTLQSEGTTVAKTIDLSNAVKSGNYTLEITNGSYKNVKTILVP